MGKSIYQLFILIILVLLILSVTSIVIMYKITYNEKKTLLKELCENQQEVIQSVYNETKDENVVLSILNRQKEITNGLGTTGEYTLGYLKDDSIFFLLRMRAINMTSPFILPVNSKYAIPMQYALKKNTGYIQGIDYDSSEVLSYATYIPELKWGLVTKMDISEVRSPFYIASRSAFIIALLLLLITTILFRLLSRPIKKKIEEGEENYRRLFEYSAIPIWREDYSEVKKYFDKMKSSGITDFRTYFDEHKDEVNHLASLIKVVEINQKSVEFFGAEKKDDVIKNILFYYNEESLKIFKEELIVLAEGGKRFESEMPRRTLSGNMKIIYFHLSVISGYEDTLSNVLVSFIDITERKKKEVELQKLNRTLSALSKSSQEMIRARKESVYLDEVCKIIINDCGYAMVWIGYAEENEEKTVKPMAFSGSEKGYLETLNITWADTERGKGPTGTAIRTGKPAICKNMLTDPAFKPWCEDAIIRGYASSVVLPLIADSKTFGAISIYSKEPDSFTNNEIELLSELANDLAYGILSIRRRIAQKKAEEALRESEEKFSKIFMTSPFAIALSEERTGILSDVNPAWEKIYGFSREEAVGRSSFDLQMFVSPQDREKMIEALNNADEINSYEMNFRLRDDKKIITELAGSLIDLGGKNYIIAISQDITERKQAELALLESQQQNKFLANLVEISSQAFGVGYPDGRMGLINNAFERLTGYSRIELQSIDWANILTPHEWIETELKKLEELNKTGVPVRYEKEYIRKDGTRVPIELLVHVVKDEDEKPLYYYSFITDITERRRAEEVVKESEKRLNAALDAGELGSWGLDIRTKKAWRSLRHDQIFGYKELLPEWTYEMFLDHVVPEDRENVDYKFGKSLANFTDWDFECRIKKADGTIRWIWAQGKPLVDDYNEVVHMSGFVKDITKRKRVENALRESEEKFRAIALNTPDHILIQDKALKYVAVINPQLGLTEKDMIGKTDYEILSKEDAIEITGIKKKVLETGISKHTIAPLVALDGTIQYFDGVYIPKHDSNGAIDGIIGYFRNVTERMKVEEVLKESQIRTKNILESIADTFYSVDDQWRFTEVNPAAERAPFGRPAVELLDKVLWELYPNLLGTRIHQHYLEAAEKCSLEQYVAQSPLNMRWYEVFIQGRKKGVDVYMRDISERKKFENELKEKNAELEETNAIKDKFFKIIAHDMKNPFISLLGASELLYENAPKYDSEKIATLAKVLNDSAKNGYDMLLNLLDWARSQAGNIIFKREKINLKELLDKNLSNSIEFASGKMIKLIFDIPNDMIVYADKNMLETILRNLINNALKFTPKFGEVTVGTKNENGSFIIFVKDTGVGIEKKDFDKLFRTDIKYSQQGTEHEGGTGLGLLLCKEFVEKHGGKIWVESEAMKGSIFYFDLGSFEN